MKHPIAESLAKQYAKSVARLSDQQLKDLLVELNDLSQINCGWVAYELRGATREIVLTILDARRKEKSK